LKVRCRTHDVEMEAVGIYQNGMKIQIFLCRGDFEVKYHEVEVID
jgi:hypothetical protein